MEIRREKCRRWYKIWQKVIEILLYRSQEHDVTLLYADWFVTFQFSFIHFCIGCKVNIFVWMRAIQHTRWKSLIPVKNPPVVKSLNWPVVNSAVFYCLSDSVGPSGKLLQPEGDGAREREKAEWREDALRSVSGFMELCTSDPPPWIAIRDHSFSFYLFYWPALSLLFPSSTPPMKVSGLAVCRHVCLRVCVRARVCAKGAPRHTSRSVPCAHRGLDTVQITTLTITRCSEARGGDTGDRGEPGLDN